MQSNPHNSESQALADGLKWVLQNYEDTLMEKFIEEGPKWLRARLNMERDGDWSVFFDYLVLKTDVMKKCAIKYMDFFKDAVEEQGPQVIKRVFAIEDQRYAVVFEQIFDLVAIGNGALYQYVLKNRQSLSEKILKGKGSEIRKELCIENTKYDALWTELLGLLQQSVCDRVEKDRQLEQGLHSFNMLMNTMREHRSLRSYSGMWAYHEA